MDDILRKIIAHKKEEVAQAKARLPEAKLREMIATSSDRPRGFMAAMRRQNAQQDAAVIAEIKRASPSLGLIREDFSPAKFAQSYAAHGATCLSVLTDEQFFQGNLRFLQEARNACALPVLRKDFIIDTYQITESRAYHADCILLIVAALSDAELAQFYAAAQALELDVLVEVHSAEELARARQLPTRVIGVNNRNLRDFTIDMNHTVALKAQLPEDYLLISESGFHHHDDILAMRAVGVNSFLIGGSLMQQPDPGVALGQIIYGDQ